MFERTGVTRRNLLCKDRVLRCEVEGVYKKKMVLIEGGETETLKGEGGGVTRRTLREESEQCIFLCIIGFFG